MVVWGMRLPLRGLPVDGAAVVLLLATTTCHGTAAVVDGGSETHDGSLDGAGHGDASRDSARALDGKADTAAARDSSPDAVRDTSAPGDAGADDAPCVGAPFPSVLHTRGRSLVDGHGCTLPRMKGFSIQIGPWSQATLDSIAARGATFERLVLFWDALQSSDCAALSSDAQTYISNIDQHLTWAANAGIYTELDIHLNVGRIPACASGGASELVDYMSHGQWITQYLAERYGSTSSAEYTKDVVGFGLNEPPPVSEPPPSDSNTVMETNQATMLSWIRGSGGVGGYAPTWIGFVAYAYANSTPIFNANPGQSNQCSTCANANPTAYDAVGGNVILDFHEYMMGCTSTWTSGNPGLPASACDGRQFNGEIFTVANGGWALGTGDSSNPAYPAGGESEATAQSQIANFVYPYTRFSHEAQIPFMIGEFGWDPAVNTTGDINLINDYMSLWATASPAIEMEWDYNVSQSQDGWAADPGSSAPGAAANGWLSFTNAFFAGP